MNLQILELDSKLVGQRLGQKLYNPKGNLLLGLGAEIKEFHLTKIKEVGYRSVYALNGPPSAISKVQGHVISEKLLASAPITLRNIYERLKGRDKIQISNAKKDLSVLADALIREVNIRMHNPPDILDLKRQNDYIYQHAINVAAYAILIGQSAQYHQLKLFDLALAALLHDFGMTYVDDEILYKPDELDEKETMEMRKHTILGFKHLARNCFIKGLIAVVCMQHHERYDGAGYPEGKVGDDIHEYSQIISVADFFDAYTSDRPYRRLHTIDEAVQYINDQDGRQFSPRMVKHFLRFFDSN
ncbi:MAG: HD-GYP domain-containing protein [bacterium]